MRAAQIDLSAVAPYKSRFKRLFERQALQVSPAREKDELLSEPSSLCLDGMVRSFLEDGVIRAAGALCCNCFHAGGDNSDDEDGHAAADAAAADIAETIKAANISSRSISAARRGNGFPPPSAGTDEVFVVCCVDGEAHCGHVTHQPSQSCLQEQLLLILCHVVPGHLPKQKAPKMAYDYYVSGVEDEWTLNDILKWSALGVPCLLVSKQEMVLHVHVMLEPVCLRKPL